MDISSAVSMAEEGSSPWLRCCACTASHIASRRERGVRACSRHSSSSSSSADMQVGKPALLFIPSSILFTW